MPPGGCGAKERAMEKRFNCVGRSIPRLDAPLQVTGRLVYGEDLYRPGMLYASAKYSEHMHARIVKIDTSAAEAMPGVHGVITWRDIPVNRNGSGIYGVFDQPVLAEDRVRYRGDAIAVVAAETREQARAAAEAVKVTYEPLPAVFTVEEALAPGAPLVHPELYETNVSHHQKIRQGDTSERMFDGCYLVEEKTFSTQKVDHAPIEPHVALAEVEPDGQLVITTSTSRPFNYLGVMTNIMQMPATMLRIRSAAVGGAFGGKNEVTLEPWVGVLAQKTGRPVKMVFSREEDLNTSTIRHAYKMIYKTGVSREGKLLANQVTIYANSGAYLGLGNSTMLKAIVHACGPYTVPNVKADAYLVYTNTLIGSSMRGMGVPQVCYAMECQMDNLAHKLGMDPVELRRRNLFGETGQLPNGQVVPSQGAKQTLERAWEIFRDPDRWGRAR